MTDLLELSDRLWRGEADIKDHHPFSLVGNTVEFGSALFIASFANSVAVVHGDQLLVIDPGSQPLAKANHQTVREWTEAICAAIVYTHGHIDHVFGADLYDQEAIGEGREAPRVIAHSNVPRRFDRYRLTAGYNSVINRRQFQMSSLEWPTEYRYPDQTFDERYSLDLGGQAVDLVHAKGETDDHAFVWFADRRLLACGDFFIWASPNAGNPQKVQRYPLEWAHALRAMDDLNAEILLPGHGLPVMGEDRVHEALCGSAELLESLVDQTLSLMNQGATLDEVIHSVEVPPQLSDKPFLQPIYDEPEFIVRNVWRLYGGWWDGEPDQLKPAPRAELAEELVSLAGGSASLVRRAKGLMESNPRLASHLVELAFKASPQDEEVRTARAQIYASRAEGERSTMARGIFGDAGRRSS